MKCTESGVQCKLAVAQDSGEICVSIWTMVHSDMCGFWGIVGLHTREFSFPDKMVPLLIDTPQATLLSVGGGYRNMVWINTIVHGFSPCWRDQGSHWSVPW